MPADLSARCTSNGTLGGAGGYSLKDIPFVLSLRPMERLSGHTSNGFPMQQMNADPAVESGPRGYFEEARFMALDCPPVTTEAISLAQAIANAVEGWENAHDERTNRRGAKARVRLCEATGRFAGDLLLGGREDPSRWSYRGLSPNTFTGGPVSSRNFNAIMAGLRGLGLIETMPGFRNRDPDFPHGRSTRFRATSGLLQLAAEHGVEVGDAARHFVREKPRHPLVLKSASIRRGARKASPREIKFARNDTTRRLEREVREINDYLTAQQIDGGAFSGYRRIFNRGDRKDFSWNKGGRLYAAEGSYQGLPKAERLKMRIGGEPVVEIDIRASYMTILLARHGLPLPTDPYEIEGLPRAVVKAWVTITLGHSEFHRRWPAVTKADLRQQGVDPRHFPILRVQRTVSSRYPFLARWPESQITCFDLMYLESEAIVQTMLALKQVDVPSLSVHDSIIVPAGRRQEAEIALRAKYEAVVGTKPRLETSSVPT